MSENAVTEEIKKPYDPNFYWDLAVPVPCDKIKGQVERLTIRRPLVGDYEQYRNAGGDIADTYGQAAYFLRVCVDVPPQTFSKIDLGADYNPLFRRMLNFLLVSQWEEYI